MNHLSKDGTAVISDEEIRQILRDNGLTRETWRTLPLSEKQRITNQFSAVGKKNMADVLRDTSIVGRTVSPPRSVQDEASLQDISVMMGDAWSDDVQHDYDSIVHGRSRPLRTKFAREFFAERDLDPARLGTMPERKRHALANDLVRAARRVVAEKREAISAQIAAAGPTPGGALDTRRVHLADASMATVLSGGRDDDVVKIDGRNPVEITAAALRRILLDAHELTPAQFAALPEKRQRKISQEMLRIVNRAIAKKNASPDSSARDEMRRERTELHSSLRAWAAGPLALEHPQGSSYHHLLDYDARAASSGFADGPSLAEVALTTGHPQIFVVERDWARAFAGYDLASGESPLPFPHCLFEFRISGVRVLAFFRGDGDSTSFFCVYGRGGVWVADDFKYRIGDGTWRRAPTTPNVDGQEFPRVARLVADNVRVACIMVDAEVAVREVRHTSPKLAERRARENRLPPPDHYVMDLKKSHRPTERRSASAGAAVGGTRTPQRGHFRRGTWVHYDDVDSGEIQYADDGGFWHSRTWRRWHFAGDPERMITKEYRL